MKHNQLIKKLFLVFTLSLFSNQSFAEGCPDGSEPVKSISDDGTYFVYNCGGSNTANSSTSSQKLAKALAGIDIENEKVIDLEKDVAVKLGFDFNLSSSEHFIDRYLHVLGFHMDS